MFPLPLPLRGEGEGVAARLQKLPRIGNAFYVSEASKAIAAAVYGFKYAYTAEPLNTLSTFYLPV